MTGRIRKTFLVALIALAFASVARADYVHVDLLATGTTDVIMISDADATVNYLFCGFSSLETVGSSSSTVRFYSGEDANGELLFAFSLTASESRSEGPWAANECFPIPSGLFVDRGGSGSTLILAYYRTTKYN